MPWKDKAWRIVIEFERSSSPRFQAAVAKARERSSYCQLMDHRGRVFHRAAFEAREVFAAADLLEMVKAWKDSRVYFDGEEAHPDRLLAQLDCYMWRAATRGVETCPLLAGTERGWFPVKLGCEWRAPRLFPGDQEGGGAYWFVAGEMEEDGVWRVDKEFLKTTVKRQQRYQGGCPIFHAARLEEVVERLPERLDARRSDAFRCVVKPRRRPDRQRQGAAMRIKINDRDAYVQLIRDALAPLELSPPDAPEGAPQAVEFPRVVFR